MGGVFAMRNFLWITNFSLTSFRKLLRRPSNNRMINFTPSGRSLVRRFALGQPTDAIIERSANDEQEIFSVGGRKKERRKNLQRWWRQIALFGEKKFSSFLIKGGFNERFCVCHVMQEEIFRGRLREINLKSRKGSKIRRDLTKLGERRFLRRPSRKQNFHTY